MLVWIWFFLIGIAAALPAPFHAAGSRWSVREVDESVCAAGSRQYAGRVNVTEGKSLFFWFFESRHGISVEQPIVIWMNGGPGASSMVGLFSEVGPCTIDQDLSGASFTPHSWSNHANLLVIDQPAGVGLSTIDNTTELPHNLVMSSPDFLALLRTFYGDIFPQYAAGDLYIAGESFGGRYAPHYGAEILRQQIDGVAGALQQVHLRGLVLVNALVDIAYMCVGQYDLFCTDALPKVTPYNATVCDAMAVAVPECERLQAVCAVTREPRVCWEAGNFCSEQLMSYLDDEASNHLRNPYDLRERCDEPPVCGVDKGIEADYLSIPDVQKKLGFSSPIRYNFVNWEMNELWAGDILDMLPSTPQVTYLLDGGVQPGEPANQERALSVLVVNGEYDGLCNLPGNIRQYEQLPWHGQAEYRAVTDFAPWYWTDQDDNNGQRTEGGSWKGRVAGRGLEFLRVRDAGHMAPGDQRGAVADIFGRWGPEWGQIRA